MNTRTSMAPLVVALVAFWATGAYALTGKEIIEKSDAQMRGATQVARYSITVKTRRWTRTMKMNSWYVTEGRKSFGEIMAPAKDAGNRFLLVGENMQHYQPKLQKVIKISPSMMLQSWMGSDFTNDDMVKESSIVKDYDHVLEGKATIDGFECYKVIMKPKPGAPVVWGKIVYYARVQDLLPVLQQYYNQHDVLKRSLTCSEYRTMHDRVIPTVYVMQSVKEPDKSTTMVIEFARFDTPIPASTFSLQNLMRK